MAIVFVGVDLAKNVFAVHGVNEAGQPELARPAVPLAKLLELIASPPPCTIGMEACTGAHHWAREFEALGHTARLMARKFALRVCRAYQLIWDRSNQFSRAIARIPAAFRLFYGRGLTRVLCHDKAVFVPFGAGDPVQAPDGHVWWLRGLT